MQWGFPHNIAGEGTFILLRRKYELVYRKPPLWSGRFRRLPVRSFGLVLLLSFTAIPTQSAPATRPGSPNPNLKGATEKVLQLVNAARQKAGVPQLQLVEPLSKLAAWFSGDLAVQGQLTHKDRLGRELQDRFEAFGYSNFEAIGENIAAGQPTPEQVVTAWMKSPAHRANILSPAYSEIGISYSYAVSSKYKYYWVMDLGSRQ